MYKKVLPIVFLFVLAISVLGCSSQPTEAPAVEEVPADEVALKITGMVDNEMAWSEDQVKAMETTDAERENKEGELETYTGVSLNALLEKAGVQNGATTVVLVADDGYEAEVTLAELSACADCIASFRTNGGFSAVLPGFANNVQVKGIVEIKVK
jgi:hypothetical protein